MSSRHLSRVVGHRGKTQVELDRENFEKNQTIAINKAINTQETPVKEKHLRNTILGTFTDKGGGLFWAVTNRLPLQGNPIICWKFCHVLHKLLREGHPHVITDSQKFHTHLLDLGKLWHHLREGYGPLIGAYTKLLAQKLVFHRKNAEIPGNLMMSDEKFARVCGSDVNHYFELSVDMLDYMDEVLDLQQHVFNSLDMSRSNSMTNSGQCRLAPLILCILDSCQLYDYIVKSLFKLHSSLPPDTLSGHRDRFLSQYRRLKQFYFQSGNLQYFKNLVQVPFLPDDPPNFLIASDFSKHVKPVAVVPDQDPEPEPEPEIEPEIEPVSANLIDTSPPQQDQFDAAFGEDFKFNGGPPEVDERDLLIERLTKEIHDLRAELERVKAEDQKIISSLKDEISKLEKILSELRLSADKALKENERLQKELETAKVNIAVAAKLTETEKLSKANEEKFKKMKEVYNKLRDEHVTLLRQHAEVSKQHTADKKLLEEKEQIIKDNENDRFRMEEERRVIQDSLQKSADDVTADLAVATAKNTDLERTKQELESQLKSLEESKTDLERELQESQNQSTNLESQLSHMTQSKQTLEEELSNQITVLQGDVKQRQEDSQSMEEQLKQQISQLQASLDETSASKEGMEKELSQQITTLQQKLEQLMSDKQNSEKKLTSDMDDLHKRLIERSIQEGRAFIQDALDQFENPTFTTVRCTAEFLLLRGDPVLQSLKNLQGAQSVYSLDRKDLETFVETITAFSHHLGDCLIHGIATSHSTSQIESGEELANVCRTTGESGLEVLSALEKGGHINSQVDQTIQHVEQLMKLTEALIPKMEDVKAEEIGDMVDNEMHSTSKAIEEAAQRIEEMLRQTRQGDVSGIELEVNERILDACTDLMKAIRILVEKSRDLQREIVAQGRGTSTAKDFYKKNHRWTEGFLSAAKAVGFGAKTLVEAADKVVKGEGKLDELIVCSQEIAASTAQLVVSSRVKAQRSSKCLASVREASKGVSSATGNVVASVKTGLQAIEDQNLMDFSQLSLIQTKRQEMDSQVRVLELERELEMERQKLSKLRKQHYTLAGESEGFENEERGLRRSRELRFQVEDGDEDTETEVFPWTYAPLL